MSCRLFGVVSIFKIHFIIQIGIGNDSFPIPIIFLLITFSHLIIIILNYIFISVSLSLRNWEQIKSIIPETILISHF